MLKPVASIPLLIFGFWCFSGCGSRTAAEAQFLGTWSRPDFDSTEDLTLYPDHTFILSGESMGEYTLYDTGTWYLGYKRIFLRRRDRDEGALVIMNVSDVTPDELKISHSDHVETYKREKTLTPAEIQSMLGKRLDYSATPRSTGNY